MDQMCKISSRRITLFLTATALLLTTQTVLGLDLSVRPGGNVRERDTLVITCRVAAKQPLDLLRIVRRINGKEYEVATNDYLKEKYRGTGRYWITTWDNTLGLLELTISEAKGEDSGNFGCRHIPSTSSVQPVTKFIDIIIDVPPKSVDVLYEARDGRWYKAGEGERIQFKNGIRCNVQMDGSDFEPKVVMSVVGGSNLETAKSIHKELGDEDGFTKITHSVQHTAQLDGSDLRLHGKTLTCSANTPQFNPHRATVILEIPHAPQLSCSREWLAQPCSENYTLSCRGLMFPDLVLHTWSWGSENQYKLIDGKSNSEETARFHSFYHINENNEYVFQLIVDELKNRDFGSYRLNVSNSVGFDHVIITIVKESRVTSPVQSTTLQPLQLVIKEDPSPYQLANTSGAVVHSVRLVYSIMAHIALSFLIYTGR